MMLELMPVKYKGIWYMCLLWRTMIQLA